MASIMAASCSYSLNNASGTEVAKGEAEIKLEDDRLMILPKFGEAITLSYIDVIKICAGDFRIAMTLLSKDELTVFDLGYKFDDIDSTLFRLRNEILIKYLLMNESIKRSQIWGDLTAISPSGTSKEIEKCEIRIYETSFVFMPRVDEAIRVHFASLKEVEAKDYAISVKTERGDQFIIQRLGMEFDNISRDLSDAINALTIKTQSLIKELAPSAEPSSVMALSRLMKDGRAIRVEQIKSISPIVWSQFEKSLEQTSLWKEYQYLQSLARQGQVCIGLKRGLMGDLTGNYLWMLLPIYGPNQPYGNGIALEATKLPSAGSSTEAGSPKGEVAAEENNNPETGGNATYFFRLVGRKEYSALASNTEELDKRMEGMISRFNDMMTDINFRREPIFLSEEKLTIEPKYAKYRYAVQKIPSLNELRKLFIGRVIHSSFDQWQADVTQLLEFNIRTDDDGEKWQK
jgi:hypothetical protein